MTISGSQFTPIVLVSSEDPDTTPVELQPLPLRSGPSGEGYDESFIQELFFHNPGALPIREIDGAFGDLAPVCMELSTPAGFVDALYANANGMLALAEFKLWRNPEARRAVIEQILDYAKELAQCSYSDLQREVSRRLGVDGNALYDVVRTKVPELDEAAFVDDVSRNLKRGRFLLLVIGDGIREGMESIVDFLQQHTGLQFTMALVEAAIFRLPSSELLVQPRILARSVIVNRTVVELANEEIRIQGGSEFDEEEELSESDETNQLFWAAVLKGLSLSEPSQKIPRPGKRSNVGLLKNPVLGRSERRIMQSWPPGGRFGAHGCCGRAAYPAKHVEPCRRPEGSQGKRRRAA